MESLLSLLSEHGILGIVLALSIFGGYRLLQYTKSLIERNEERLNKIIDANQVEREKFIDVLGKHADSLDELKVSIDEMRVLITTCMKKKQEY